MLHATLRRPGARDGAVVRIGVGLVEARDPVAAIGGAAEPEIR